MNDHTNIVSKNILLVGDVHATVDELDDCEKLIDLIHSTIDSYKLKDSTIVFLGDQTHNHAILNVHVLNFWKKAFSHLREKAEIIALVGNHDLPGATGRTDVNSMSTLDSLVRVVDNYNLVGNVLYIGYQHDKNRFIDICNKFKHIKHVVCHQTFDGARYENGFLASDGIKFDDLPDNQKYISGHIHTPSQFGNVTYIGAPRWRTASDADVIRRNISWFDSETGLFTNIETGNNCKRFVKTNVVYGEQSIQPTVKPGDVVYYNITGPTMWVEEKSKELSSLGIIKKTFTDQKTIKVKESDGINKALEKYIQMSDCKTPKDELLKMVEDRIWK